MQKAHDASKNNYWRNYPNVSTPIVQEELNRIETDIDEIDDRVVTFDTTKANQSDMLQTISNITFDRDTGIFTVTKYNGTSFTIDTDLEKIAVNFDYDPQTQQLILTLIDGTVKYIDLSELITQFEFVDTATIHFSVTPSGQVTASIINGSITEDMLRPNFLADCNEAKAGAQAARAGAETAEGNALEHQYLAEEWAVGERNGVPVSSTNPRYENNSEWYAQQAGLSASNAAQSKEDAEDILDQIIEKANVVQFRVDFTTGELMYTTDTLYEFRINSTTGNLEWRVAANG